MRRKKLLTLLKKTGSLFTKFIDDLLLVAGMVVLTIGVYKIYVPAGYISSGICLIAFAFLVAKKGG